jgi:hypothetical protein
MMGHFRSYFKSNSAELDLKHGASEGELPCHGEPDRIVTLADTVGAPSDVPMSVSITQVTASDKHTLHPLNNPRASCRSGSIRHTCSILVIIPTPKLQAPGSKRALCHFIKVQSLKRE